MNDLSGRSITLIHYSCPPVIGGAEFILEAHARWFKRYGADVEVIVGEGETFEEGVPVETIEGLRSDYPGKEGIRKDLEEGNEESFREAVEKLKNELRPRLEPTNTWMIHNLFTMPFNLVATVALRELARETDAQTFLWTHDIAWIDEKYECPDRFPWNLLKTPLEGSHYVAISGHRRNQLRELFGNNNSGEISVVHDAVEFDLFHELDPLINRIYRKNKMYRDDIIAVYPARIVPRKNFELALRIVRGLKDLGNRVHFLVTGPPDPHNQDSLHYFERLIELRDDMELRQEVIFCYELEHPETGEQLEISFNRVRQLYRISDILLMTSRQEGFGLPLLEAALTRTVICCSNIEPLSEVGGEAPVYFELDDAPDAIAGQIHEHLQTQATVKLQRRARKIFTWPAVFEREMVPLLNATKPLL